MPWERIGYAALCVVLPAAWGLVIYWTTQVIERRALRQTDKPSDTDSVTRETLGVDYNI